MAGDAAARKLASEGKEIAVAESSIRRSSADGAANVVLQPPGWPRPKGFANGILARGEMVFVGGMIGQDRTAASRKASSARCARRSRTSPRCSPRPAPRRHIVRLTWYVRDMDEYLADLPALGAAYRDVMGRHFPPWRWSRSTAWSSRWRGSRSRRPRCCRNRDTGSAARAARLRSPERRRSGRGSEGSSRCRAAMAM